MRTEDEDLKGVIEVQGERVAENVVVVEKKEGQNQKE